MKLQFCCLMKSCLAVKDGNGLGMIREYQYPYLVRSTNGYEYITRKGLCRLMYTRILFNDIKNCPLARGFFPSLLAMGNVFVYGCRVGCLFCWSVLTAIYMAWSFFIGGKQPQNLSEEIQVKLRISRPFPHPTCGGSIVHWSNMVQKRPFDNKETFEVPSKHQRQTEHGNQLFSSLEFGFSDDVSPVQHISGGAEVIRCNTGGDEKLVSGILTEHQGSAEDVQSTAPGCVSVSSWPTSSTSEEDSRPGTPFHEPIYWEYLFPDRRTRQLYTLLMGYPPQKPVPIGEDHQADIAAWGSQCTKETSSHTCRCEVAVGFEHISRNECENFLVGTCVIPMPDLGTSAYSDGKVGKGRNDCLCEDRGSIRCVRQHITEAREELKEYIGQERFEELGFLTMGEVVADKWSDEEQKLFDRIVYSNPVSLGKKFWDVLSAAFPSRTIKDIISYYFNVFMLRRLAMQNRCPAMNIDSDNDEWQGTDNSGVNETGMSDENEDSGVETPAYNESICYHWCLDSGLCVYKEDTADGTCNDQKLLNSSGSDLSSWPQAKKGDREVQDDSCTSSDTGPGSQAKADEEGQWHGSFNELRNGVVHECSLEHSSGKAWDAGYPSYQNKV